MKEEVENKISNADNVSKAEITDKIKAEHSDRYDQMIVSSEIERNDVLYVNYKAQYINVSTQKIVFAMTDEVAHNFNSKCAGGEGAYGAISELDDSIIRSIKNSNALIAEKTMGDSGDANSLSKTPNLQYLSKGFMDSKEVAASEDGSVKANEESSVFGSIKKIMNEPIGGSKDEDDDDDYQDVFESIDWFGSSAGGEFESSQYDYVKNKSLKSLTFEYNGELPSKKQPLFFVPYLTNSENCKACKGDGEVDCPSCKGTGELKCPGEVVSRKDAAAGTNEHQKCSHGIMTGWKQTHNDAGWGNKVNYVNGRGFVHAKCGGTGKVVCTRSNNSRYGIGKLADLATGRQFCEGAKVIKCKPCKATGQIGTLVYVKSRVGDLNGEFFKYTNQKIDQIVKKPSLLYPYLKKGDVRLSTVYKDINGSTNENYDNYSASIVREIQTQAAVNKGSNYPRLMHEEVYYDIIPLASLEYNHILTATNHTVSAAIKDGNFDILFHSDPTAVKRFSLKNLFKSYFAKWPEAFMTKSYKSKRDKYNEIRMLIYVAKADGTIADEEKIVLANTITGLTEYTATEKSKLFGLMSSKSLPELIENDFVISTRERAEITFKRLDEMAMEDAHLEKPEGILVKEYKERINANLGKYKGKFKQFITTWQVSITVLVMFLTGIYSAFFFMYLKPRKDALKLHNQNIQNEKILTDFIAWTGEDTTQNLQFSNFLMDLSISNSENSDFDESIRYLKPLQLLDKMNHQSEYMVEDSKVSYKDYWKEHTGWLRTSLDSLMPILERRIASQSKPTSEEVVGEEEFVADGNWYTVSDPDGFSNLRETPNGNVLQEIYEGQLFEVIGVEGVYKKVRLEDGVTEGYIHSSRIVLFESSDGVVDEPTGVEYSDEENSELDPEYQ
jgi:hypothetical protein